MITKKQTSVEFEPAAGTRPTGHLTGLCHAVAGVAALVSFCAGAAPDGDAAAAPPPPNATAPPSVKDIVAGNATARGGLEAWHRVTTVTERGRIEHGQLKAPKSRHAAANSGPHSLDQALPFVLQFKRPHKMRLEMDLGDTKALQLFDGTSGWTLQPSSKGPLVHEYSSSEASAASSQVDPEGPLLDAGAKGTTVSLEGEDVVEGHPAYKLKLTLKNGAERHVWVDTQSFLDLKIDGTQVIEGRVWPTTTFFYDWKQAGSVKLPGRIETAIGDFRTTSRIVVEQVILNASLNDAVFSLSDATRAAASVSPAAEGASK